MNADMQKTVLVVDDEPDVVRYLRMALLDAGFNVETAANGEEGLAKVKEHRPDLISLDLVMPKHSGARFFRELQKNKEYKDIPVLIVTGHAHDELGKADLEELTMSGPGIYLEKPVKPHNYISAVKQLLGMESTEEDAARDADALKGELKEMLDSADPEAVRRALEALKKKD